MCCVSAVFVADVGVNLFISICVLFFFLLDNHNNYRVIHIHFSVLLYHLSTVPELKV